jgi:putative NADPH-quinone reductase
MRDPRGGVILNALSGGRFMPSRIAIIQGHPDPEKGHYCNALAQAYAEGARAASHKVDIIETARLDLPFIRNQKQWREKHTDPAILAVQETVRNADHLVIIYPLWLGDMPAILKSFLEHLSCGGFVISLDQNGHWDQNLKGKSARVIVTMGMPAIAYRLFYFSHSLKSLERNILKFAGVKPVRTSLLGMVEGEKRAPARAKWLAEIRDLGARAV